MGLKNTNFENIKIDSKNKKVYKSIILSNDYHKKMFDELKPFMLKLSHLIDYMPNITIWERKEYNAVIGSQFLNNLHNIKKYLDGGNNLSRIQVMKLYFFCNFEIHNKLYEACKHVMNIDKKVIFFNYNNYQYFLDNLYFDNKGKFWMIPNFLYINVKDRKEFLKKLMFMNNIYIHDSMNFVYRKLLYNSLKDKQHLFKQKILENQYKILDSKDRFVKSVVDERITYSELHKIIGDKLFNEYFGDK